MSARPGPSGGYHVQWYPYRDLIDPHSRARHTLEPSSRSPAFRGTLQFPVQIKSTCRVDQQMAGVE